MRFRPQNLRETDPVTFDRLVQNNPYLAKVHDYPELLLPYPTPKQFQELWEPKAKATQRVHLEIGCGSGRYLSQWAAHFPEDAFLGFELRFKRITLAAKKLQRNEQSNALLLRERGEFFDDYLQPGTLDVLHVNFPDPWPKARHARRRLVQPPFVRELATRLVGGGSLFVATDDVDYAEQIHESLSGEPLLANLNAPRRWTREVSGRMQTGYERAWREEGRLLHFFVYSRKVPGRADG